MRNSKEEKQLQALTAIESATKDFVHFLDSLYYDGYAQQLASEHPREYSSQFNEYFENYFSHV